MGGRSLAFHHLYLSSGLLGGPASNSFFEYQCLPNPPQLRSKNTNPNKSGPDLAEAEKTNFSVPNIDFHVLSISWHGSLKYRCNVSYFILDALRLPPCTEMYFVSTYARFCTLLSRVCFYFAGKMGKCTFHLFPLSLFFRYRNL